jgi:hypothetical protein
LEQPFNPSPPKRGMVILAIDQGTIVTTGVPYDREGQPIAKA